MLRLAFESKRLYLRGGRRTLLSAIDSDVLEGQMKNLAIAFLLLLTVATTLAQESGVVTATKANLRGTPSTTGVVVTTLNYGDTFELVKDKAPWYLVQTPTYVGWIHGSVFSFGTEPTPPPAASDVTYEPVAPKTTTKDVSGTSYFETEYVGGSQPSISVTNSTDRMLTFVFGGVKYTVAAGGSREIEVNEGRYEYTASVPGARPTGGVENFKRGVRYIKRFYITRR